MKRLSQRIKRIIRKIKELPEYGYLVVPEQCSEEEWLRMVKNPDKPTRWVLVGGGRLPGMQDNTFHNESYA